MNKIRKIGLISKEYRLLASSFGIKIASIDFIRRFIIRGTNKLGKELERYKHENIKKYIKDKYGYIIEKYKNMDFYESMEDIKVDAPIWIFWWQGLDQAPLIVKKCIDSIKSNSGTHPINIITKFNYEEYVSFPDYIIEKLEKGQMTITHFSDIMRMQLLYVHGGIWMDATLYMTDKIPSEICNYSYYTIRHELYGDYHVCKGLWTGFFLACNKGNIAFKYYCDMFFEYWKNENHLICYLLIDCIMSLGYENISVIHDMVELVPKNNAKVFELESILSSEYSKDLFDSLNQNTQIYKLTYRKRFIEKINGKMTFYGYIFK